MRFASIRFTFHGHEQYTISFFMKLRALPSKKKKRGGVLTPRIPPSVSAPVWDHAPTLLSLSYTCLHPLRHPPFQTGPDLPGALHYHKNLAPSAFHIITSTQSYFQENTISIFSSAAFKVLSQERYKSFSSIWLIEIIEMLL